MTKRQLGGKPATVERAARKSTLPQKARRNRRLITPRTTDKNLLSEHPPVLSAVRVRENCFFMVALIDFSPTFHTFIEPARGCQPQNWMGLNLVTF